MNQKYDISLQFAANDIHPIMSKIFLAFITSCLLSVLQVAAHPENWKSGHFTKLLKYLKRRRGSYTWKELMGPLSPSMNEAEKETIKNYLGSIANESGKLFKQMLEHANVVNERDLDKFFNTLTLILQSMSNTRQQLDLYEGVEQSRIDSLKNNLAFNTATAWEELREARCKMYSKVLQIPRQSKSKYILSRTPHFISIMESILEETESGRYGVIEWFAPPDSVNIPPADHMAPDWLHLAHAYHTFLQHKAEMDLKWLEEHQHLVKAHRYCSELSHQVFSKLEEWRQQHRMLAAEYNYVINRPLANTAHQVSRPVCERIPHASWNNVVDVTSNRQSDGTF
ncbi:hypothetical protein SeMB42_g04943 [Synchytrium endobioticum]|uniref:Uncharacterized protein n=1 Tax=Synchytrium endobioticum TaxID=286115 RepID=A0A507CUT1_9FUNG|nr:hypothetical protein SeLEV6574_g06008 [Synchytrium endobioticum]TPX42919.1 hypothetical protein SeMB42_g04943 [Synchytrium endobioticum]